MKEQDLTGRKFNKLTAHKAAAGFEAKTFEGIFKVKEYEQY